MAKERLVKAENINVTAREIDFVTRFQLTWEALRNIMGICRPIPMVNGTKLTAKKASVTLQSGAVGEGESVPYSAASVYEVEYPPIVLAKYKKGTSIEAINKWGYDIAIGKTDEEFKNVLQNGIMGDFYSFLRGGDLTNIQTTFQSALALARGLVTEKFQRMNRSCTDIIAFVNTLDFYNYLGSAAITVQNEFGFNYIKNFMGYNTIFLVDGDKVPEGTVCATPVENIVMYYVNPADSEYARAGLGFTTIGETPFIGSHIEGNYDTYVSENNVLVGLKLFAEYIDGIAVVKIEASGSIGSATITSAAATDTTGATKITLSAPSSVADDWHFFLKAASAAPTAPSYKGQVDSSWTEIKFTNGVCDNLEGFTSGHKAVLVITNGSGQAIYASASAGVNIVVKA